MGLGLSSGQETEKFLEKKLMLKNLKSGDRKLLLSSFVNSSRTSASIFTGMTLVFFILLANTALNSEFSIGLLVLVFGALTSIYLAWAESKMHDAAVRMFAKS